MARFSVVVDKDVVWLNSQTPATSSDGMVRGEPPAYPVHPGESKFGYTYDDLKARHRTVIDITS